MSTIWSGGMEIFILNTYLEGKLALRRQLSVGDHDSHNFILSVEKSEDNFLACSFILMPCFELGSWLNICMRFYFF